MNKMSWKSINPYYTTSSKYKDYVGNCNSALSRKVLVGIPVKVAPVRVKFQPPLTTRNEEKHVFSLTTIKKDTQITRGRNKEDESASNQTKASNTYVGLEIPKELISGLSDPKNR